jgi:1,4-dihydroxy-2-naphthoate octaprenyltransferase
MKNLFNTIKLLRFPFSFFLLPVSLFSFYFIQPQLDNSLLLLLVIWHILVFPASNGYNSYNDNDDGPIGGLANPPKPTKMLLHITNAMDIFAVILSCFLNFTFAFFVLIYIIFSRLYSYRKIRLKQFPITGFLVVFVFQGAWIFFANIYALGSSSLFNNSSVLFSSIASSFLIATIYPITQIYQHDADHVDGVKTLSLMLGKRGTFIFSATMFLLATIFIFISFKNENQIKNFWLYNLTMLPVTCYFAWWAIASYKKEKYINFKNTMTMLVLSSSLSNIYFTLLLLLK